jgi:hypothetical protein
MPMHRKNQIDPCFMVHSSQVVLGYRALILSNLLNFEEGVIRYELILELLFFRVKGEIRDYKLKIYE